MSILISKDQGAIIPSRLLYKVCKGGRFKEIGVCFAKDGKIIRSVGFSTVGLALEKCPVDCSALLYFDNPESDYEKEENYSPILSSEDTCFAFCGEMLALSKNRSHESNNKVFSEQVMAESAKDGKEVLFSNPFKWLIGKVARSFVGGIAMDNEGNFVYYNEVLFNQEIGWKWMDSEISEKQSNNYSKPDLDLCLSV